MKSFSNTTTLLYYLIICTIYLLISHNNIIGISATRRVPYNVDNNNEGTWSSTIPGSGIGSTNSNIGDSTDNNELDENDNAIDNQQEQLSSKPMIDSTKKSNVNLRLPTQDAAGNTMRFSRTQTSMSMRKGKSGGGKKKKKAKGGIGKLVDKAHGAVKNGVKKVIKKAKCAASKKLGKFGKKLAKHCPPKPKPPPKPTNPPTTPAPPPPAPVTETPPQPVAPQPNYQCSKEKDVYSFLQIGSQQRSDGDVDNDEKEENSDNNDVLMSKTEDGKVDLSKYKFSSSSSTTNNMRFSQTRDSMSMRKGKGGSSGDKKKEKSGLAKHVDKGVEAVKTAVTTAVKKAVKKAKCHVGKKLPFGLGKKMAGDHCPKPKKKKPPVKQPVSKPPTKPSAPSPAPPSAPPAPKPNGPVSPIKQTWADVEACEACKFVWDSIAIDIAQMDYESVASAFDDVCNEQPEIFARPCEEMRSQLGWMIKDFLIYKKTSAVCSCAGMYPCDKVNRL